MKADRIATWRRGLGAGSTALGFLLLGISCFIYLRYASDPMNLHVGERLHHSQAMVRLWIVVFYGSALLFLLSLLGFGWSRWVGLTVNCGAFLCALMTLGALCGPFGC
jgi:hypothetical protein